MLSRASSRTATSGKHAVAAAGPLARFGHRGPAWGIQRWDHGGNPSVAVGAADPLPPYSACRPSTARYTTAAAVPASIERQIRTETDVGAAALQWACQDWDGPDRDGTANAGTSGRQRQQPQLALSVGVRDLGPGRGRGLLALEDIAPDETLLSVSFDRVFSSEPDSELHWSAEMAVRLLQAQRRASLHHPGGNGGNGSEGSISCGQAPAAAAVVAAAATEQHGETDWGPWLLALPAAVRTPLEYSEEEVAALRCPYMVQEVQVMQQCVQDCFEVVQPELEAIGCGWQDFLWAVQVFHSRCFFEPVSGRHMTVPGVDMANHSATPSAGVRIVHAVSQGYDAIAEIAEPPPPEPSRFTLVAGDEGIRAGEEVTISYGRWPSEAFLLLFGFVPSPCPGEALTLFRDAEEAVRWCLSTSADGERDDDGEQDEVQVRAVLEIVDAAMPGADLYNLVVTPEGIDGRLEPLLSAISGSSDAAGSVRRGTPRDLLVRRIKERAQDFMLDEAAASSGDAVIEAFRRSKAGIAEAVSAMM